MKKLVVYKRNIDRDTYNRVCIVCQKRIDKGFAVNVTRNPSILKAKHAHIDCVITASEYGSRYIDTYVN